MGLHCGYCGCYCMPHEMGESNSCIRCYNNRNKKEKKKMTKPLETINYFGVELVKIDDYLKVVEEKELYKENLTRVQNHLQIKVQECKEKDEEIEKLKERIEKADSRVDSYEKWYNNNVNEFNKIKEENERLKNLYENEIQYEEWAHLYYECEINGNVKHIKQDMLLEDAYELVGMDSDNWRYFSIKKFKKEVE